jgi:hypothetical protein
MHLVRDQQARHSEAIYRQYVQFSKNASHIFTLLVLLAAYIAITQYTNWKDFAKEQAKIRIELSQVFGPFDSVRYNEQYYNKIQQVLDERVYRLPIINLEISGTIYFIASPAIFFITTIGFWINLRYANKAMENIKTTSGAQWIVKPFPWAYNIPLEAPGIVTAWQLFMELFPAIFMLLILSIYIAQINIFYGSVKPLLIFSLLPLIFHYSLFSVGYQIAIKQVKAALYYFAFMIVMYGFLLLTTLHEQGRIRWFSFIFISVWLVGFFEFLLYGRFAVARAFFGVFDIIGGLIWDTISWTFNPKKRINPINASAQYYKKWYQKLIEDVHIESVGYIEYVKRHHAKIKNDIRRQGNPN